MSSVADQPGHWSPKVKSPDRLVGFGERFESTNQSARSDPTALSGRTSFWPLWVFLISLEIPWIFYLGPLRISVYRLVLIEAMRFGFAAPILLLLAGISIGIAMAVKRNIDERLDHFRTACLTETDAHSTVSSPVWVEMGSSKPEIFATFPPGGTDEQPLRQATRLLPGSKT